MTVEEIEILVTAKIEEALKEFAKLAPTIQKEVKKAQEAFNNVDTKQLGNNVKSAVNKIKSHFQNMKKATNNNELKIKVNNSDASKQVTQLQKEIDSLQKKISEREMKLNITNNALDKMRYDTNQQVVSEMPDAGAKRIGQQTELRLYSDNNYTSMIAQSDKLNNEIIRYNALLDSAKAKMSELGQETNQTANDSSRMSSFINGFKGKIEQAKASTGGIKNVFQKVGTTISKLGNKIKNTFQKAAGIIGKVKDKIKSAFSPNNTSGGLKSVLKYAGALFGLSTIYNTLQQCASTWLSSQNAGAQQLSTNINYMKYAMGSALAPVIQFITNLVYKLMKAIQQVAYALTGVNIFANATANSMNNTTKNAKKATKAMKTLAGVHDEINNISDNKSDSGDSGSGSVGPNIDLSKMDNTSNSILDAIKNGNWYQVGAEIANKLNEAMASIDWTKIQEKAKTIATNIGNFINGFVDKFNWNLLGTTIGNGINTALTFLDTLLTTINFKKIGTSIADTLNSQIKTINWSLYGKTLADGINTIIDTAYGFVTKFDFKKFGTSIATGINSFFKNIKWEEAGQTLTNGIKGIFDGITGFIQNFDWKIIIDGLVTFLKNVDVSEISQSLFTMLGSACGSLVNLGATIGEYIKKAFSNIGQYFSKEIEECGGNVVQGIFKGIIDALRNLGNWIIDNVFKPFIDGFKSAFGIHSPSTVMAEMGGYIIDGLKNGIKGIWDKIKSIFENLKNNISNKFKEIVTKIKEKFSISAIKEHFSNAVTGIKDKFSTIQEWFKSKFSNVVSKVKSAFSLSTIKSHFNSVVSGIKNVFSNIPNWFKTTFSNAWQKVKNVFSKGGKVFTGIKEGILSSLKGVINGLIGGINKVIKIPFDGINKALNKIREIEIFGNRPFGGLPTISVPQIPKLAKGNVAYNETLAIFGEYSGARNNPEITAPQNIMYETMLKALADSNSNNDNKAPIYLIVKVGNKTIGQILIDELRDTRRRTGKGIEAIVGG